MIIAYVYAVHMWYECVVLNELLLMVDDKFIRFTDLYIYMQ